MNPGVGEEVGQTARSLVDALKANPVMLGLVLVIVMQIGLMFFIVWRSSTYREHEFSLMMQANKDVQQLLSRCIVPEQKT